MAQAQRQSNLFAAEDFRTIYNTAWKTHSGFKGISSERALLIFKKMKMVIDEKLVWFVYHNSEPVAFLVSLPELNEVFKYIKGICLTRSFFFGFTMVYSTPVYQHGYVSTWNPPVLNGVKSTRGEYYEPAA